MSRQSVIVLHAYQLIGVGLRAAFPIERFDVRVVTTASPARVFRSDLSPTTAPIEQVEVDWNGDVALELAAGEEIVTNDEGCSPACARLRAARSLPSRWPQDLSAYANKVVTKTRLAQASVPVPAFRSLALSAEHLDREVAHTIDAIGVPLVVKPEAGGYNTGVAVLESAAEVRRWFAAHVGEQGWQAERYLRGRLFHANGFVMDGKVVPVQVGAYVSAPLGASRGAGLGSVTLPWNHPIRILGTELNDRVAQALGVSGRFVLHTEFFVDDSGQAVVIDVAARAPGALVSDIAGIHAGVNLETASFLMQLGYEPPWPQETGTLAGWLWSPPHQDGAVSCFLAWNRRFEPLVTDLERAAAAMGNSEGLPWLRALVR